MSFAIGGTKTRLASLFYVVGLYVFSKCWALPWREGTACECRALPRRQGAACECRVLPVNDQQTKQDNRVT